MIRVLGRNCTVHSWVKRWLGRLLLFRECCLCSDLHIFELLTPAIYTTLSEIFNNVRLWWQSCFVFSVVNPAWLKLDPMTKHMFWEVLVNNVFCFECVCMALRPVWVSCSDRRMPVAMWTIGLQPLQSSEWMSTSLPLFSCQWEAHCLLNQPTLQCLRAFGMW